LQQRAGRDCRRVADAPGAIVNPSRPRYSEAQQQQRELESRRALEQLVEFLMNAASDAWHDQRLWGHGDRARYFGRGATLLATVDRQSKVMLDHPDAGVRADRLVDLHDMLEATAIIGGCLNTPAARRLRGANARKGKSERSQQIEEAVLKVCEPIRAMHPKERPWWVAGVGREQVNRLLGWDVSQDCIADHLQKNWRRLEPSLRPRKT
jgi:hypothetical protein